MKKRKIADLIQKLEEAGCEINKLEWQGNSLYIDVTPSELAIPVFKEFGYTEESKSK